MCFPEFYFVKRIDNSRLVRAMQPARTRDLARTVARSGPVAT